MLRLSKKAFRELPAIFILYVKVFMILKLKCTTIYVIILLICFNFVSILIIIMYNLSRTHSFFDFLNMRVRAIESFNFHSRII